MTTEAHPAFGTDTGRGPRMVARALTWARLSAFRSAALIACAPAMVVLIDRLPVTGGDTPLLARSSQALVSCIRAGVWRSCPGAERFGLQQHLVGMALAWKGFNETDIVTALTVANAAAFVLAAVWIAKSPVVRVLSRRLLLVLLFLGPPLAYAIYSFGEMLSVLAGVALTLAIAERRPLWLVAALAAFGALAKETAAPPVVLLGWAAVLACGCSLAGDSTWGQIWHATRLRLAVVAGGAAIGVVANSLFNVWRYDSVTNPVYGDPMFQTPGWSLKARAIAGIWLSPGGGAVFYWLSGTIVVAALLTFVLIRGDRSRRAAAVLTLMALGGQTIGLSAWWSPFGWYAWGPRLLLPTLATAVCVVAVGFAAELSTIVSWLVRHRWVLGAVVVASAVSAAANAGFTIDPNETLMWFYSPHGASCPVFPDFIAQPGHYYDCVYGPMMWNVRGSLWARGAGHVMSRTGAMFALAAIGAAMLFLGADRRERATTTRTDDAT